MNNDNRKLLSFFLQQYLQERPLFLSLIRSKEAYLFDKYFVLRAPALDVGCGDGYFAKTMLSMKSKMKDIKIDIGLDLGKSRIAEARKLHVYKKVMTYDGEKIPFEKNSFLTVVSNCVLEHIRDLPSTLSEIHRVLQPKGFFYTTVMTNEWEKNLFGSLVFGNWYKGWMRKKQVHINLLSHQEWDAAFKKVGFSIEKRVGYLSPRSCKLIDICHYVSLPSLLTYKLFGKWVLFPQLNSLLYPTRLMVSILDENVRPDRSGALFYLLRKR